VRPKSWTSGLLDPVRTWRQLYPVSVSVRRTRWMLAAAGVALAVLGLVAVVVMPGGTGGGPTTQGSPANVATVERGRLAATVSAAGILTYQARPDGSPYPVTNQAEGTYTMLPAVGDKIACGGPLYRVDEKPVVLLCGPIPSYRELSSGATGPDVHQLNQNLHALGYDRSAGVQIDPGDQTFTPATQHALEQLQRAQGLPVTGRLQPADAIFLAGSVRVAAVTGELGAPARAGTPVAQVTSDTLVVQVSLDAWQQDAVKTGAEAQITLPTDASVQGTVVRVGGVAKAPDAQNDASAAATIPVFIGLDDPSQAHGLDEAPVQVQITSQGVDDALSVPVTALVGRAGGGFAVEVVRDGGKRDLVGVQLGLFDTGGGRVQVEGDLHRGDHVVVPSL
jgi:peptidoglycan hydrolase-like protein with peptidoglycan-binding domain